MAPSFKPAYLIHGDDHGRIAERRARLRELAESISGAEGVELLEGDDATPERAAAALDAMTLTLSRRFIIVDGVERWKDKELDALVASLGAIAPETTIAFFAREESRNKAPDRLHAAVSDAGGDISPEISVKPWELPKWAIARARELGIELEPDAARALVRHVGDRQQRLLRELEKLALGADAADRGHRASRRRDGAAADRLVGRATGVDGGRCPRRRRGPRRRHRLSRSCASRASACPACSTGSPSGSGPRTRSPPRWTPASRRPRSSGACGCPPAPPTGSSPTRGAPAPTASPRPSARSPTSSSRPAAGAAAARGEDTAALIAIGRLAG